jgi:hypothetical protein
VKNLPVGAVRRRLVIMLVVSSVSASVAAAAPPPKHLAPPGNPAVTEYLEDVPSDMGASTPRSGQNPSHTLTARQRQRLDDMGSNGKVLVNVVNETAPQVVKRQTAKRRSAKRRSRKRLAIKLAGAGSGSNPSSPSSPGSIGASRQPSDLGHGGSWVSAILGAAIGEGGGLGMLLPALIAVGLLSAILAVTRRRAGRRW